MEPVKRSYRSQVRDEAARATRLAVVRAAHALFVEQGWAATTVAAIAEAAGVSRPTANTVGGKAQLLALARDVAMAGDDEPLTVTQRASFLAVVDEPDLGRAIELYARHVTAVQSRYAALDAVLHQASSSDPDAQALWQRSEQERRAGAQAAVDVLRAKGAVRGPVARAVDAVWALMASEPYRRLVLDAGWSERAYSSWLAGLLRASLLGDSHVVTPSQERR